MGHFFRQSIFVNFIIFYEKIEGILCRQDDNNFEIEMDGRISVGHGTSFCTLLFLDCPVSTILIALSDPLFRKGLIDKNMGASSSFNHLHLLFSVPS
jgi:hypothetical protein